jgi:hypothetical protein
MCIYIPIYMGVYTLTICDLMFLDWFGLPQIPAVGSRHESTATNPALCHNPIVVLCMFNDYNAYICDLMFWNEEISANSGCRVEAREHSH